MRLAIGASRLRVVRQLMAESLLLAGVGALLGALVAQSLSRFLVSFLSTNSNRLFVNLESDWRVMAFTSGLAVVTCVLFGLTPAVRATRTPPGVAMKTSGRGLTDTRERFGLRRTLVVVQVALSVVLVVAALLFVRTLRNLMTLDPGFRQDGILVADLDLRRLDVPVERRTVFFREIVDELRVAPDVDSAASTYIVPVSGSRWNNRVLIGGAMQRNFPNFNRVSPGFFKTMGIALLAGRDLDERDTLRSPRVAIINEKFAREYFGRQDPLGRTFQIEEPVGEPRPTYQVIGVVKDTKYTDLREPFTSIAFLAEAQDSQPSPFLTVVARSSAPLAILTSQMKRTVTKVNPAIAIDFLVFKTRVRESLMRERLMATLSGFFGILAGLLATIGLYGVMSYMVARRTNEIGIRMALGADRRDVVKMVMREAGILVITGLIGGAVLALAAARTASTLLFGLQPSDPATVVSAIGLLAAVSLIASYLPARRAARLEPTVALREE